MCFKKASGNLLEPWVSGWVALTWLMNFGGKYIRVDMIVAGGGHPPPPPKKIIFVVWGGF